MLEKNLVMEALIPVGASATIVSLNLNKPVGSLGLISLVIKRRKSVCVFCPKDCSLFTNVSRSQSVHKWQFFNINQDPRFDAALNKESTLSNPSELPIAIEEISFLNSRAIASILPLTSCPGALHNIRGTVGPSSFSVTFMSSLRPRPCHGKSSPRAVISLIYTSGEMAFCVPIDSSPVNKRPKSKANTTLSSAFNPRATRAQISMKKAFFKAPILSVSSSEPDFLAFRKTSSRIPMNAVELNS
mmetsp:Transcript_17914/g.44287  ORF Transcript_17914/g.44287 Transcript_17914/m.44287 type:complete len:244 (+) Transcript_17914:606-1337(+)